jgi:predicted nucleotidyltransferase
MRNGRVERSTRNRRLNRTPGGRRFESGLLHSIYAVATRLVEAGIERDKGDDVLDLAAVDLDELAQALEDHSYDHSWWLDGKTGEIVLWSDSFEGQGEPDPELRGLRPIDPVPSHEGYEDMQDFIDRVRDPQARRRLERAIEGRGAFRRFKDTLLDFPQLREAWFRFHDARIEQRAIRWLAEEGLVEEEVAERAVAERADPELPELSGPFDPHELARQVAQDLRGLYGDRLRKVLLFGSWARGDAHPESDIDLLVVLDRMDSTWEELRRMDALLWRHSFENDTVVTALPVAQEDVDQTKKPVLVRAETEGLLVG